jgi:chromosome segregation ATPase
MRTSSNSWAGSSPRSTSASPRSIGDSTPSIGASPSCVEMFGHFDEIYRRLERLEQEYHAITQALRRIEAGVAGERGRREILERDLAELKEQVSVLQSRIEEIEARLGR